MSIAKKGKHLSEETKKRMSDSRLGEKNHFFGKHHADETKKLIREHNKWYRHSEERKKKIADASRGRKNTLGMKWYNNGIISKCFKEEPPAGWVKGRIFNKKRNKK